MLTAEESGSAKAKPAGQDALSLGEGGEDVWLDVIRKMDEVYSELVDSQTELEEKNTRLEEAHTFIGSVLAAMTDVLIVCDVGGMIQQVNPALEVRLGRRERALKGTPLSAIFDAQSQAVVSGFLPALRNGGTVSQCDLSLAVDDPNEAAISVNCTPRRDHRGQLVGMVLVGRPIGELQRAYQELDTAHRELTQTQQRLLVSEKMAALGRLVAGVAHELNNPISFVFGNMYALKRYGAAISKYLDAANERCDVPELQRLREELKIDRVLRDIGPLVDGTLEGAERVRDIVQDLRRFSSNQEETPEVFNVTRLVRTAVDWVVKTQRVKPALRLELPDRLEIRARKGQLHQIIVNLLQNAADVLVDVPAAEITVMCRRVDDDVVIDVADNGPGIAPEMMDKIFEPFFTTKPVGSGTGLGLYISYNMAVKQGGDLIAANRPEGGAVFTLRMPADEHAQD